MPDTIVIAQESVAQTFDLFQMLDVLLAEGLFPGKYSKDVTYARAFIKKVLADMEKANARG